jgi:CelD/BcsL family acetyltransferase involved in cellulose biosynthesis
MAVLEVGRLGRRAFSGVSSFRVEFVRDWKQALSRWGNAGSGTSFQHAHWLAAWYGAFAAASPLIAIISDTVTDRQVALVPLIHRMKGGIRIVEFADLDLTDYNAPILGPRDAMDARVLCRALMAALRKLPEGVDLIRLRKMPAYVDGRPNPLASLGRLGSCSLNGNLIVIGDDFDVYRASIKRMQLPRSWRVFNRNPGAAFRIIGGVDAALTLLDTTDAQQQTRMQSLGLPFHLNDATRAKFYRNLVSRGLEEGYVVATELRCGEEIVATALGVRRGTNFVFLRISNAG